MAHDHLPPAHRPSEGDGYDASHGWDMAIDVVPEEIAPEFVGPESLEGADGSIEWGSEGALARALLSAALTDVAPSGVRERVLSAVDAVLREPVAVPAFPADAAPVTTLSGVFEKRRPTTEAASCIGSCTASRSKLPEAGALEHAVPQDGLEPGGALPPIDQQPIDLQPIAQLPSKQQPSEQQPGDDAAASESVASHEHASVGGSAAAAASSARARSIAAGRVGDACFEQARSGARAPELAAQQPGVEETSLESGHIELAPLEDRASLEAPAGPPLCAMAASGVHCCGGPMVGGRCRSKAHAMDTAGSPTVRVASSPIALPLHESPFRVGVAGSAASGAARGALGSGSASIVPRFEPSAFAPARDVAVASNLDASFTAAERSTSARLRDGVVASAFNLAQLAAAIVVGIVIGKAAHLVMAGENAMAWSPTAGAEGGLRAEPSRAADAVRASDPVEASVPHGSVEPPSVRSTPRPRAASAARGSMRASASVRGAPAATARPAAPCNLASAHAATAPVPPPAAFACPPAVNNGSWAPQPASLAAVAPALMAPLSVELAPRSRPAPAADNAQPPLASASDDWLGEQLAILGRAERSLVEDDPESAVRSLDEYKARFPDGLLDPQMASIRQRVEERFTAFIFP
jgi:hypothetical protein